MSFLIEITVRDWNKLLTYFVLRLVFFWWVVLWGFGSVFFFLFFLFSKHYQSYEFKLLSLWARTLNRDELCHCQLGSFSSLLFNMKSYILPHCATFPSCGTLLHAGKFVFIQEVFYD